MYSARTGIIDSFDLSGNQISDRVLSTIVGQWFTGLREIDISHNVLGRKTLLALVDTVNAVGSPLQELNLAHMQLTTGQLEMLSEGLFYNTSLLRLNLAHNEIEDRGGMALHAAIANEEHTCVLQELDMSWNNMSSCLYVTKRTNKVHSGLTLNRT